MCGIVGLFLKDKQLQPDLGGMLTAMLITMTNRGPDSAGIAIYGPGCEKKSKLTIQSDDPINDFKNGLTRIPACMPDKYKVPRIIESYKLYYKGEKENFARYTRV